MPNLVGTGLNQVPTNSMLGGLAYQDPEHASIKNLDLKNLSQINSEIADTAVDVFVYDTSKDSDGGAWRKRTQHTSWYNETLNTSTRGSRKEFPAVAVLVLYDGGEALRIYDGDDPDLPMWMDFTNTSGRNYFYGTGQAQSIAMLNGMFVTGAQATNYWPILVDFLRDDCIGLRISGGNMWHGANISGRNTTDNSNYWTEGGRRQNLWHINGYVTNQKVNDVAMTVLPNAPVDSATGLPIPTIAVATDGGVSVIKDDGTVVDFNDSLGGTRPVSSVIIRGNDITTHNVYNGTVQQFFDALLSTADSTNDCKYNYTYNGGGGNTENITATLKNTTGNNIIENGKTFKDLYSANPSGLSIVHDGFDRVHSTNSFSIFDSKIAYVTSDYNTGWMHGDIKGAFLSDTDIEDGVELVSNGTFNTDTTGWTMNGGGSTAIVSGQVQLTNNGTTNCSLDQTITTVIGQTYEISANITPQGGGPMPRLYVGNKYVQVGSNSNSSQTVTLTFLAYSTSTIVSINANTNVNNAVTLADNVSMKLTNDIIDTSLITNGTFDSNITGWGAGNGATLTHQNNGNPGGNINVASSGSSNGYANQSNTTVVGKYYTLTFDHYHVSGNHQGYVNIGTSLGGGQYVYQQLGSSSSWTTYSFTFKATTTSTFTGFYSRPSGGGNVRYDNISLKEAEEDRSVSNNPLAVFGTITKSAVATGADLVGYSGFSASNYLQQPYNSGLDFGTGDFSVMGWFKATSAPTTAHRMYRRGVYNGSWSGGIYSGFMNTNSTVGFNITPNGYSTIYALSSSGTYQDGNWHHLVQLRNSSGMYQYIDGKLDGYSTNSNIQTTNLDNTSATLVLGGDQSTSRWNIGDIALWRISGSAPSAEQVSKMYNDEKFLFQENAKATLYGSSDAVTALAYDEVTDQLHVGTSAGRSDFQGLRRINNTTTAVTTAISAHDEFIIEQ